MTPTQAHAAAAAKYVGLPPVERLRLAYAARARLLGIANATIPVRFTSRGPHEGIARQLLGPFPGPAWTEAARLRLLSVPEKRKGYDWTWRTLTAADLPGGGGDPAPDLEDDLADERRAVLALAAELPFPEGRARAESGVAGARTREELQELRELVLATLGHAPSPDAASEPAGARNGSSRERYEAEVPSQSKADFGR